MSVRAKSDGCPRREEMRRRRSPDTDTRFDVKALCEYFGAKH
jgi:hypothetical protein